MARFKRKRIRGFVSRKRSSRRRKGKTFRSFTVARGGIRL